MSNPQYAQKLQVFPIPDIQYVLNIIKDDDWYFSDNALREIFSKNAFDVYYQSIDSLNKEDMQALSNKLFYTSNKDENFMRKLMNKTLEFNYPFLASYQGNFDIFSEEEKLGYVKALNSVNYHDFDFLKYRITKDHGAQLLCNMYKQHFYGENGIVPCENFNMMVMSQDLSLIFNNSLVPNKKQLFQQYLDKDDSKVFLYNIGRTVHDKTLDIVEQGLLQPVLEKAAKQTNRHSMLNTISEMFSILNNKDISEAACKIITQTPDIKKGLIRILQEKIQMPRDHDISNFNEKFNECKNMNFLQYMIFTNQKNFALELCKQDNDFMQVFNNVIHENRHGFLYENSPLDLVLRSFITAPLVENLYIHKLINNELKPKTKDKLCAVLFIGLSDSNPADTRYHNLLNAITLMDVNLISKYAKHYKDIMSDRKLDDIDAVKNMLELQNALPEHSHKSAPRVKI